MSGDRRRADVEGNAEHRLVKPRPHAGDRGAVVNGDGDAPASSAKRLLEHGQDVGVALEPLEAPLALERVSQPAEVARRRGEVWLLDLDVVETHDRLHLDRVGVRLLAHDLAVHLALGRHVDDELTDHARRAAEPARRREPTIVPVRALDVADRGQMRGRGDDRVLRVLALAHLDLATTADPAAAADRVDVDPEASRGLQHGRAVLEAAAPCPTA